MDEVELDSDVGNEEVDLCYEVEEEEQARLLMDAVAVYLLVDAYLLVDVAEFVVVAVVAQ